MAGVIRPCYASREDVARAADIRATAYANDQIDRAICGAADDIDERLHRQFFPETRTVYFDWPNPQDGQPWRIRFDANELADITTTVPVVTSGGVVIPASRIFWGPVNYAPPYTYMELDRSSASNFAVGTTPQRNVSIAGTFGYWLNLAPAGTLGAAMNDTTGTVLTRVSGGTLVGVGDVLQVDSERLLITERSMVSSSQTQQGAGAGTNLASDNILAVTDGTKFVVGETLLLDAERMLVVDISVNNVIVKRAWDGSVLATHSGATIFWSHLLTVVRGALGTTAATHSNAAPVSRCVVPALVRELAVAESLNNMEQENAAYSRTIGEGDNLRPMSGAGLADIRKRASVAYGRGGSRHRAV
jgi:hypothetical protein